MEPAQLYSKQIESLQSLIEKLNEGKDKNGKHVVVKISSLEPNADTWPCIPNLTYSVIQLAKNNYIDLQRNNAIITKVKKTTEVILSQEYGSKKGDIPNQKYLRNFFISHCCEKHGDIFIEAIGNIIEKPEEGACEDMPQRALKERFIWLQQRVEKYNFPEDQQLLGKSYHFGWGTPESRTDAVQWYQKSAAQGMFEADAMLGYCYNNGDGVERAQNLAIEHFKKAAGYGVREAMQCLGFCYLEGIGVEQSPEKGAELCDKGYAQKIPPNFILWYE
jgi:hypothetical protein